MVYVNREIFLYTLIQKVTQKHIFSMININRVSLFPRGCYGHTYISRWDMVVTSAQQENNDNNNNFINSIIKLTSTLIIIINPPCRGLPIMYYKKEIIKGSIKKIYYRFKTRKIFEKIVNIHTKNIYIYIFDIVFRYLNLQWSFVN